MFELVRDEYREVLRCQIGTLEEDKYSKHLPMAFTELGVAMLSSVLYSKGAIQVNIQIVRAFTRLRQMISTHEDLRRKIEAMERKYDDRFRIVFEAIKQLIREDEYPEKRIGFEVKNGAEYFSSCLT